MKNITFHSLLPFESKIGVPESHAGSNLKYNVYLPHYEIGPIMTKFQTSTVPNIDKRMYFLNSKRISEV